MNVLVLGSGGREHAIAWKLRASLSCESVYLHPGNSGTWNAGFEPLPEADGIEPHTISQAARKKGINLIVIGPEIMLARGYADILRQDGFMVVGPGRDGAMLECSKVFAKEFMKRASIPTAAFLVAANNAELISFTSDRKTWPVVLKLDGLASGKGVVIAQAASDIEEFADRVWKKNEFGPGPHRILIEDFIEGRELSYIGLCDGHCFIPLSSATDYKRVGSGNTGPNTGGMGSISPSPYMNAELEKSIEQSIVLPILKELQVEGISYRGALYIGLMIDKDGKPHVLEFNSRFGDPETQALLLRTETDFAKVLEHTALGTLKLAPPVKWRPEVSLYVVASAEGYPASPRLGDVVSGVDTVEKDVEVFFSGVTAPPDSQILTTSGGRVLGLGTIATDLKTCREKIYRNLKRVNWKGIYYRDDIGL